MSVSQRSQSRIRWRLHFRQTLFLFAAAPPLASHRLASRLVLNGRNKFLKALESATVQCPHPAAYRLKPYNGSIMLLFYFRMYYLTQIVVIAAQLLLNSWLCKSM